MTAHAQTRPPYWSDRHDDSRHWYGWCLYARGTVCVMRSVRGTPEVLAIQPQADAPNWAGAFSIV